jgi:D-3-phosphoglycerate dehydrogenase
LFSPEHTILVAEGALGDLSAARLRFGDRVHVREARMDLATLSDRSQGANAIVVTIQPLYAEHIAALSSTVRVIGRAGVGLDNIDIEAARHRGISITYQPTYATGEVATHAMALLLGLHRRLLDGDRVARHDWMGRRTVYLGVPDLSVCVVGIIGCGSIGRAVLDRVGPLAGHVLCYDPNPEAVPSGVERVDSLDAILERADILTIHVPLASDTACMIGREELRRLRAGALLVNVSRGDVVDEAAVAEALRAGWLGGYAADTFSSEPLTEANPLFDAPRTLFSPHMAWYSDASARRIQEWTLDSVLSCLLGVPPVYGKVIPAYEKGASSLSTSA